MKKGDPPAGGNLANCNQMFEAALSPAGSFGCVWVARKLSSNARGWWRGLGRLVWGERVACSGAEVLRIHIACLAMGWFLTADQSRGGPTTDYDTLVAKHMHMSQSTATPCGPRMIRQWFFPFYVPANDWKTKPACPKPTPNWPLSVTNHLW